MSWLPVSGLTAHRQYHGASAVLQEHGVSWALMALGPRTRGAHTRWLGPPWTRALFPPPLALCDSLGTPGVGPSAPSRQASLPACAWRRHVLTRSRGSLPPCIYSGKSLGWGPGPAVPSLPFHAAEAGLLGVWHALITPLGCPDPFLIDNNGHTGKQRAVLGRAGPPCTRVWKQPSWWGRGGTREPQAAQRRPMKLLVCFREAWPCPRPGLQLCFWLAPVLLQGLQRALWVP